MQVRLVKVPESLETHKQLRIYCSHNEQPGKTVLQQYQYTTTLPRQFCSKNHN